MPPLSTRNKTELDTGASDSGGSSLGAQEGSAASPSETLLKDRRVQLGHPTPGQGLRARVAGEGWLAWIRHGGPFLGYVNLSSVHFVEAAQEQSWKSGALSPVPRSAINLLCDLEKVT